MFQRSGKWFFKWVKAGTVFWTAKDMQFAEPSGKSVRALFRSGVVVNLTTRRLM